MITTEQIIPILLKADPRFEQSWKAYLNENFGDESLLYTLENYFCRQLVDMLEANDTASFDEIFTAVENLLLNGDDEVVNLIGIGIVECLLANHRSDKADEQPWPGTFKTKHPYDFEPWLMPETKRSWLESNKGYYGRTWPQDR